MVTVTAQTSLSSSLDDTWTVLGRRECYLCFPGLSVLADGAGARRGAVLHHELDLPLLDRQQQTATLSVARGGNGRGRRVRRFTVRGDLVSIAGRWQIEPAGTGVRVHLTLDYEIAPGLKERAVNELRSRSPLPIRTDADAILGRAVDDFMETRFAQHAADYCERLRARLDGPRAS
jgi:hypothetical protein